MEKLIDGHKLDTTDLAPQFERYYQSGQRIIVQMSYGDVIRGYVGKTTGWRPSYLLLATTRSIGSSELLKHNDQIVGTVEKWRIK
jgi:hypothetical protein